MESEDIVGRTITAVKYMTAEELETHGWRGPVPILVLDDYTEIVASCDDEGNGPGVFWIDK